MPTVKLKWVLVKEDIGFVNIHNLIAAAKAGEEGADQFMVRFLREDTKIVYLFNLIDLIPIDEEELKKGRKFGVFKQVPVAQTK